MFVVYTVVDHTLIIAIITINIAALVWYLFGNRDTYPKSVTLTLFELSISLAGTTHVILRTYVDFNNETGSFEAIMMLGISKKCVEVILKRLYEKKI